MESTSRIAASDDVEMIEVENNDSDGHSADDDGPPLKLPNLFSYQRQQSAAARALSASTASSQYIMYIDDINGCTGELNPLAF